MNEQKTIDPIAPTQSDPQTAWTLPDNAKKINEIITIIQTHKGDHEIKISDKAFLLNEEGIAKIRDLLAR